MAAWPTVDQVKTQLGVNNATTEQDALIAMGLGASIEQVCFDLGYTAVDVDVTVDPPTAEGTFSGTTAEVVPNQSIASAALILASMAIKAPDAPFGVAAVFDTGGLRVAAEHPTYLRMLAGNRRAFAIG